MFTLSQFTFANHLYTVAVVITFLDESPSSSSKPMSRPWALASLFPCTRLPTITDAGPTSETQSDAETQRNNML